MERTAVHKGNEGSHPHQREGGLHRANHPAWGGAVPSRTKSAMGREGTLLLASATSLLGVLAWSLSVLPVLLAPLLVLPAEALLVGEDPWVAGSP